LQSAAIRTETGTKGVVEAVNLFVNACVRRQSRTQRLARCLLARLDGETAELSLSETAFPVADEAFLCHRDRLIAASEFGDPLFDLARQFAEADQIVIAAPYWDLSFPAVLKQYFEQVNVTGVTFRYTPEGIPEGLCRARRLFYVTTAGGPILSDAFGFGYVEALAKGFYQIPEVRCVKAEGLDIVNADVGGILRAAEEEIERLPLCQTRHQGWNMGLETDTPQV